MPAKKKKEKLAAESKCPPQGALVPLISTVEQRVGRASKGGQFLERNVCLCLISENRAGTLTHASEPRSRRTPQDTFSDDPFGEQRTRNV